MAHTIEVPILIVGGVSVRPTTSILLSHHGIRSLLVEQWRRDITVGIQGTAIVLP